MTKAQLFEFISSLARSEGGEAREAHYLLPYVKWLKKGEFKEKIEARIRHLENLIQEEPFYKKLRKEMLETDRKILERIFDWR
ncbi:MAG: hypothetical protein GX457_17925 [Thermotogaceae bacterium]|nr:hypothetical protein [Thermotogaceae bacterium]